MKISDVIDLYNKRSKDPEDKIRKFVSLWSGLEYLIFSNP